MSKETLHLLCQLPEVHPEAHRRLTAHLGLGYDDEPEISDEPPITPNLVVGITSKTEPLIAHEDYPLSGDELKLIVTLPEEKAKRLVQYYLSWFAGGDRTPFTNAVAPIASSIYNTNCHGFAGYVEGWSMSPFAQTPTQRNFTFKPADSEDLEPGTSYALHKATYIPHTVIGLGIGNTCLSVLGINGPLIAAPVPWKQGLYNVGEISRITKQPR